MTAPAPSLPVVTVVVPVYNVAAQIERSMDALIGQRATELEVILVDDRGTDNSIEIGSRRLAEAGIVHRVVRHEHNRGIGAARNSGLAEATGQWVWFLDADDGADVSFLEELIGAATRLGTDIAICRTLRTDLAGARLDVVEPEYERERVTGPEAARMMLDNSLRGYACNKLFRRSVLPKAMWDEGRTHEDFRPMLSLLLAMPAVALVDRPLYHYTTNPVSVSGQFGPHTFDLLAVATDVGLELDAAGLRADWRDDYLVYRYLNTVLPLANLALRAEHAGRRTADTRAAVALARRLTRIGELARLSTLGRPRLAVTAGLLKVAPALYSRGLAHR